MTSANKYQSLRVMKVLTAGASGWNEGEIQANATATPALRLGFIPGTSNRMRAVSFQCSKDEKAMVLWEGRARDVTDRFRLRVREKGGVWQSVEQIETFIIPERRGAPYQFDNGVKLEPEAQCEIQHLSSAPDADPTSASIDIVVVPAAS